jgi:hypothetical protein
MKLRYELWMGEMPIEYFKSLKEAKIRLLSYKKSGVNVYIKDTKIGREIQ